MHKHQCILEYGGIQPQHDAADTENYWNVGFIRQAQALILQRLTMQGTQIRNLAIELHEHNLIMRAMECPGCRLRLVVPDGPDDQGGQGEQEEGDQEEGGSTTGSGRKLKV